MFYWGRVISVISNNFKTYKLKNLLAGKYQWSNIFSSLSIYFLFDFAILNFRVNIFFCIFSQHSACYIANFKPGARRNSHLVQYTICKPLLCQSSYYETISFANNHSYMILDKFITDSCSHKTNTDVFR